MRSIRELTQQDGWKTQQNDEKMWRQTVHFQSYAIFFRRSAVLGVPTVVLCKHPNYDDDDNHKLVDHDNGGIIPCSQNVLISQHRQVEF